MWSCLQKLGIGKYFFVFVVFISIGYFFLAEVMWKQLETGNESVNSIMAVNILHHFDLLIRPSYIPLGYPDWVHQDLSHLNTTPLNPLLLALGYYVWGLQGEAFIVFFTLLITLVFTWLVASQWSKCAAWLTLLLMVLSPTFKEGFSFLDYEPTLTAFGMAALYFFIQGIRKASFLRCACAGVLLGLGFLIKLWLIAPYVFAMACFALYHFFNNFRKAAPLILTTAFFCIIASTLHLLFIIFYSPGDLPGWINEIYFGVFLKSNIAGAKWQGLAEYPNWSHPFWYYFAVIYRDYFYLIPLFLFGFWSFCKKAFREQQDLLVLFLGAFSVLVPLSLPAIKEPAYIMPLTPFINMLGGFCFASFLERVEKENVSLLRSFINGVIILFLITLVGILYFLQKGNQVSLLFFVAHTATLGSIFVILYVLTRKWDVHYLSVAFILILLISWIFYNSRTEKPPFVEIATVIRPVIPNDKVMVPAFVSPNTHVLEFYLFHKGDYWKDVSLKEGLLALIDKKYSAYVLSPEDQQEARYQEVIKWLEENKREVTKEVDRMKGKKSGYRIFVSE